MTDQMMMLVQSAMQQTRPAGSTGSKKGAQNDNSFRDMLAQKQQGDNAPQQSASSTTSRDEGVKTEGSQQAGEQKPTNQQETAGMDAEIQQDAQMLAAAMLMQPMVLPVEQPVMQQQAEQPVAVQVTETVQVAQPVAAEQAAVQTVQQAPVQAEEQFRPVQQQQNAAAPQAEPAPEQKPIAVQQDGAAEQKPMQNDGAKQTVEQPKAAEKQPEVVVTQAETPLFHDVKAMPVKVGENAPVVNTQSADMDEKLADTVMKAELKQVGDKIEIQLEPRNLGRITVELTQKDGQLGLLIHTDNAKAANLLSQHSSGLAALVESRTNQPVQIYVQQQEQQSQPQYDGRNGQQHERQQQQSSHRPDKDEQDSFLGQLRLGLVQFE